MTESRTINYQYSDDELSAVQEKFATQQIKIEELKEEAKQSADAFKKRIKTIQTDQNILRYNIKNKSEEREIEVEAVPNFSTGRIEYYAANGHLQGQLVDSRRMTPDERQMKAEFEIKKTA